MPLSKREKITVKIKKKKIEIILAKISAHVTDAMRRFIAIIFFNNFKLPRAIKNIKKI